MRIDDWEMIKLIWEDFGRSEYSQYNAPHPKSDDEIQKLVKFFAESGDFWLVFLLDTDTVVGTIDFHDTGKGYDLGYCFLSEYQKKGYAKESCCALMDFYIKNGCKRFTAGTALKNTPSVKLLLSLGFHQIGTEQVSFYKDDQGIDVYFDGGIFELTKLKIIGTGKFFQKSIGTP